MEVMAPPTINALNGSSVKLSCTFNSCYKVENKQFSLNWTYQECRNCSEELVSLARAGGLQRGPGPTLLCAFPGAPSPPLTCAAVTWPSAATGEPAACRASSRGSCPDVAAQAGVSGETCREETVALATVVAGAERGPCCVWS